MNLAAGSKIWVEDNEKAWVQAEVVEADSHTVIARLEKEKGLVVSLASKVHPREIDILPGGVDDMIKLAYLHEPGVVYNLASRYELSNIYTYTGNILIAVNPFKKLPHLYDSHMMEQYRGAALGELNPHIFAIADTSYRAMINESQNQAILVSGESGAGKTETTKLIMQYLAFVGGRASNRISVEQQVLESNPLLEAFGNAKTVRNDNSSRFGKFVEIQFNCTGRISGAAIRTYLLERSRVVNITKSERNFHCFYQLCASSKDAVKYKLTNPKDFFYLNQSNCFALSGVDESKEYIRTRRAMDIVGISSTEQDAIFRTLAAILHLGNVDFIPGKEHDSSVLKDELSLGHLQAASELLMCDSNALKQALCTRVILTGGESITKMLDPESALINRDTLAKTIYTNLFDWLVEKINKSIGQDKTSWAQIGVLDIYGFESFQSNSFEQFCINFANEKLQQHFNEHVLKMEQEEYNKEAIDWRYIDYSDNQDVLDLIEKRPVGIISLLDEACMFPKSTKETFSTNLFQTFKSHERFKKPKLSSTEFIISHYAGEVLYQTDLFLDKNKDYVVVEHEELLVSSKDPFVSGLFTLQPDENRSCYKFSSVATRFKQQLQALVETLRMTEPHFIRCVKPNSSNKPGQFEIKSVIHQLRCGGVLEAVRISCAGYPTRKEYNDFLQRFGLLAPGAIQGHYDKLIATQKLLKRLGIDKYQLGITKVFLKVGEMAKLNAQRAEALNKTVRIIQRKFRSYIVRKKFITMRLAAIIIQAHWRGHVDRHVLKRKREEAAATLIQEAVRIWLSKRYFQVFCGAAISAQNHVAVSYYQKERSRTTCRNAGLEIQAQREKLSVNHLTKLKAALFEKEEQLVTMKLLIVKEREKNRTLSIHLARLNEEYVFLEATKARNSELTNEIERLRADIKELKVLELTRLQAALLEKQQQLETIEMLISNERETNKMLSMQLANLKEEQSLYDSTKARNYELADENKHLSTLVAIFEKKALEAEKRLLKTRKESEERLYKSKQIEMKMEEVHLTLQRLEEKMSFLEIENQVLHKKALASCQANKPGPVVQQDTRDMLMEWITQDMEFDTYDLEKPQINNHMTKSIVKVQRSNEAMAYCLSHTICLLQNNLKPTSAPVPSQLVYSLMDKMSHNEKKFPNLQQLIDIVEKIYGMLRDNLKKEISPQLTASIQASRASPFSPFKVSSSTQMPFRSGHWHSITTSLNSLLSILCAHHVPSFLVSRIFTQIFFFINVQLFNSLLLRRECCSFSNGEYLRAGLSELENWICNASQKYAGHSWDALGPIRQAVDFLVIHQKDRRSFFEIKHVLCPGLSVQQLYRIITMYWDDKYGTQSVSSEVIDRFKELMAEESTGTSSLGCSSFLLDDDASLPFCVDDLLTSMSELDDIPQNS